MNFQPLRDFLDYYVSMLGIPGTDTVVYKNHEEIFRHTAGYDDLRFKTPMRDNAHYYVYSISKLVLATATAQLIERGEIMLSDPLYAYIPEYENMTVKAYDEGGREYIKRAEHPITLKHLITMTAGFNYNLKAPSIVDTVNKTGGRAPTMDIIRELAREPLDFEPGADYKYSLAHDVMGAVIEVASGMPYSNYVKENIFAPLGMTKSGYKGDPELFANMTKKYVLEDGIIKEDDSTKNPFVFGSEYDCAGAGLITTVDDIILLADALACGGVGKSGERILSRFSIDLMRTNMLNEAQLKSFVNGTANKLGYGYGMGVRTLMSHNEGGTIAPIGEFGWDGALAAYVGCDMDNGISVYHAENVSGFNSHQMVHPRLRNVIYGCLGE